MELKMNRIERALIRYLIVCRGEHIIKDLPCGIETKDAIYTAKPYINYPVSDGLDGSVSVERRNCKNLNVAYFIFRPALDEDTHLISWFRIVNDSKIFYITQYDLLRDYDIPVKEDKDMPLKKSSGRYPWGDSSLPEPKHVLRNYKEGKVYTTVVWKDGSHTVVKHGEDQDDDFDKAIMFAAIKKMNGNNGCAMNRYFEKFHKNYICKGGEDSTCDTCKTPCIMYEKGMHGCSHTGAESE